LNTDEELSVVEPCLVDMLSTCICRPDRLHEWHNVARRTAGMWLCRLSASLAWCCSACVTLEVYARIASTALLTLLRCLQFVQIISPTGQDSPWCEILLESINNTDLW